jgi:pimeloyl-ACP methyl ester carboxylesterase
LSAHTLTSGGHTLHYLDGGSGETLVLLHGIFAEKDHWVDFARPLTPHYRVIAPDLPGFGESTRLPDNDYSHLLLNHGQAANQLVPHIHLHIIPREPKDTISTLGKLALHLTGLMGFPRKRDALNAQAAQLPHALQQQDATQA